MATLGHFGEYDEYLRMLAEAQRYKLRLNAHKGFLGDVPPARLLSLLKKEIEELEDAANRGSKIEMILEAADISNFALGFVIAALKIGHKEDKQEHIQRYKCSICQRTSDSCSQLETTCTLSNTVYPLKSGV